MIVNFYFVFFHLTDPKNDPKCDSKTVTLSEPCILGSVAPLLFTTTLFIYSLLFSNKKPDSERKLDLNIKKTKNKSKFQQIKVYYTHPVLTMSSKQVLSRKPKTRGQDGTA